jgi:hypothetical protein
MPTKSKPISRAVFMMIFREIIENIFGKNSKFLKKYWYLALDLLSFRTNRH